MRRGCGATPGLFTGLAIEAAAWHCWIMDEHTSKEIKEAEAVLKSTDHGKRVFVAETVLKTMAMGYLPRLRKLLLGARHEVRRVDDLQAFRREFAQDETAIQKLNVLSSPLGYVASAYTADGVPHTTYYCTEGLTEEVVSMLTSSIAKQHAVTLAAIGLDVGRILEADEKNTNNSE